MEGRRHSVDLPISRTLLALRRVRSLRDPSTNSMRRLVDTLNCETPYSPTNFPGFENRFHGGDKNACPWKSFGHNVNGYEPCYRRKMCNPRPLSPKYTREVTGDGVFLRSESPNECLFGDDIDHEECVKKYCKDFDEGDASCDENDILSQLEPGYCSGSFFNVGRKSTDLRSCSGSPFLLNCETPKRLSAVESPVPIYRSNDAGMMESCYQGCGSSSVWSREMKYRDSDLLHDAEEWPLLSGKSGNLEQNDDETNLRCKGKSGNFCQEFIPRSFKELVGQNAIAASLVNAICNQKISSFYLFHGLRGTGKSSASRIFAAALNCHSDEVNRPCGLCQECVLFFSGQSRDTKEVDPLRMNKQELCRSFIKNIGIPPIFSRFKVYIIDECHLLQRETWMALLSCLEELIPNVVFIMVTPSLDMLPRAAISMAQKFHFQKINEADIARMLKKICIVEGLDFDQDALNFIAAKSNGSLRDAEMTLDQLSMVGRKINLPLIYEVSGVVSDNELLDLLRAALSCDAPNTVKKARDIMNSRIDPLQLVAQLANLIMDILAGRCTDDAGTKLFGSDMSEANVQQLNQALKILSRAEKQLRASKNQITWLTAALLQLSYVESPLESDPRLSSMSSHPQDGDFRSMFSNSENPVPYPCEDCEQGIGLGMQHNKETLELLWRRASCLCTSTSLKKFLRKRGKLVSIHISHDAGVAVAELEFDSLDHVFNAEKSWKVIASALQHILGYNVELRINLARNTSMVKKPYFSLFNCTKKTPQFAAAESEINALARIHCGQTSTSGCRNHEKGLLKIIRNSDENILGAGTTALDGAQKGEEPQRCKQGGIRELLRIHCWKNSRFRQSNRRLSQECR